MKNIITLLGSVAAVFTIGLAANTVSAAPAHPLILVPTTLGTLPSEDGPVLDPIFGTYENFIETFTATANGYELGETLFVLEYDWQESLTETSAELAELIANIKTETGAAAVDIVGHGQGGLIAWHYLASDSYQQGDVNKVVSLGTPLAGIASAYPSWEGAQFRLHASLVGQGLGQALLNARAKAEGQTTFAYIQENAMAFRDLLPPTEINEYLGGATQPTNPFLENLFSSAFLYELNLPILTIAGTNQDTIGGFEVDLDHSEALLWQHGKPVDEISADQSGDGIVDFGPIFGLLGDEVEILDPAATHHELPTEMQGNIFSFLNDTPPSSPSSGTPSISCLLFITTSAGTDMMVTGPGGEQLGDGTNTFGRAFHSGSGYNPEYGVIANPGNQIYEVAVSGASNAEFTVDALEICKGGTRTGTLTETLDEEGSLEVIVSITPDAVSVSVPVVDTEAPVVSITSPVEAQVYLPTDEVFAVADITDASPIASVEYLFNTNTIDHTQALPLNSAPLGAAVVEVIATDAAGNVGSSTVSFFIGEDSTGDTGAPVVTITSPAAGSTHFSDATVLATADITDPEDSSIVETIYSFNGEVIDHTQPLPLFDAPLGAASVSVEATDSAGNTGSSTVSFTIAEPPPEPDTYTIEFLEPISPKCYIHSKKYGISKLWKRIFDRLHLHSKFKDYFKRYVDCRDISIFKAGSNVPVKFRIKDEDGKYVQVSDTIAWIEPIKGPSLNSPIEEMEYTEQPSTGYFYSWKGSHYQYNWKTSRSQRGYWYNLFIVLPDGSIHQTIVGLR